MPNIAPAVIEKHNGIITIVKTLATISSKFVRSILRILESIIKPTTISTGAVAASGITDIKGERNINGKHSNAVTAEAIPVLAPL